MKKFSGIQVHVQDRNDITSKIYRPFDGDELWDRATWQQKMLALEHRDTRITDAGGRSLDTKAKQAVKERLLRVFEMQPIFDPSSPEAQTRAYIPGLMNHDTVPAFVGPKGWGKTKFLFRELAPALIIPGRRLLNHFKPAEMTDKERQRDVGMLNSETRPGAVHEELVAAGLVFTYRDGVPCYVSEELGLDAGVLLVEHLMKNGGATQFDLTADEKRDYWEDRLLRFADRGRRPLTLIADGVTAMLGNDTMRTGAFTSAFKMLLEEVGIPNGLGVLHSPMGANVDTPMQGLESMGEWDGMWLASASAFPVEPSTARSFRTLPRLGDPEVPRRKIVLEEDGRLSLIDLDTKPGSGSTKGDPTKEYLRERLREAEPEWLWTRDLCSGSAYASNKKALEAMERDGEGLSRSHSEGRTRGYQWRLSENALTDFEG